MVMSQLWSELFQHNNSKSVTKNNDYVPSLFQEMMVSELWRWQQISSVKQKEGMYV